MRLPLAIVVVVAAGCGSNNPTPCTTQGRTQLYEDACHSPADGPMFCFYDTPSGF